MAVTPLRNFDLGTLRSFVTIAESGSMTRAAVRLNMTQSAISMQIKRLETALGLSVFERAPQGISPTIAGDQLLHFARQMLAMNDEAWGRLTAPEYEGRVRLGVPSDIINALIPQVLQAFSRDYPRVEIRLASALTYSLKAQFNAGLHDVVLTTEREPQKGGKVIRTLPLVWMGAANGSVWKKRPLPIGFSSRCAFRQPAIDALEQAGIDWLDRVSAEDVNASVAMMSADLCVGAELSLTRHDGCEVLEAGCLPALPEHNVVLYCAEHAGNQLGRILADYIQRAYA